MYLHNKNKMKTYGLGFLSIFLDQHQNMATEPGNDKLKASVFSCLYFVVLTNQILKDFKGQGRYVLQLYCSLC